MNINDAFKLQTTNHMWGDQMIIQADKERKEEEEKQEKAREKIRKKILIDHRKAEDLRFKKKLNKYIKKNGKYWYYVKADTYINFKYNGVPSIDGINIHSIAIISNTESMQYDTALAGITPV